MKVTIKDIAKLAGVSQATVSKILNNYHDVGQETRKRVLEIMAQEGYRPSQSRLLQDKKTNVVGVVFAGKVNADLTHPVFVEVLNEFKKTIGQLGYDLVLFSNEQFFEEKENYLERCQHFQVDGCLIIAGDQIESSVYELDMSPIPCVGVDIELNGPFSSYVMSDSNSIAAKVVEHLYLNGHRKIGYIGGTNGSLIADSRLSAFKKTLQYYGLPVKEEWIYEGDFFEDSGYKGMNDFLDHEDSPTAVFAVSDLMAIGAMKAVKEKGLSVPEDISIIGCDDILPARYVEPPLTTIRQDKEKMGKMAAHILLDLIKNRIESSTVAVEPELVVRWTTTKVD
ncbi:LacI family DNA-binding transcriptional regulator [Jeotgalibacillus sp. R-1-5s-1]|uniref:LacI family DNA-binding transcriptional regulator n=1 Tax=Jeotgalibacillus sp. R-1-5s-1 TaxID=2555897 RepID=UPI00106CCCD5|nr:LacI family DNA-binding transcriptional regulator [Jeotgalibacillus sp. R-1-5s-1]TFE00098.1 LacI family transcriptional regulator [Jeotgalibacillus sp. R-1-5s-1]